MEQKLNQNRTSHNTMEFLKRELYHVCGSVYLHIFVK